MPLRWLAAISALAALTLGILLVFARLRVGELERSAGAPFLTLVVHADGSIDSFRDRYERMAGAAEVRKHASIDDGVFAEIRAVAAEGRSQRADDGITDSFAYVVADLDVAFRLTAPALRALDRGWWRRQYLALRSGFPESCAEIEMLRGQGFLSLDPHSSDEDQITIHVSGSSEVEVRNESADHDTARRVAPEDLPAELRRLMAGIIGSGKVPLAWIAAEPGTRWVDAVRAANVARKCGLAWVAIGLRQQ